VAEAKNKKRFGLGAFSRNLKRPKPQKQMKILITGSTGMLGSALCDGLSEQYEVIPFRHKDCDITQKNQLITKVSEVRPQVIIHTAAFTDVDGCELNPQKAYDVNAKGTETVAITSHKVGALLIHISTDYVFDGKKREPYLETDTPNPINIYGKTKLEGERFVQSILRRYLIIRSSWLFGEGRKNFVNNIIERTKKERTLSIVNDKFGCPTYTSDLAKAIKTLLQLTQDKGDITGIYHITNSGSCSWYEYAQKILECAAIKDVRLLPITLNELNLKAPRPKYSILDNQHYYKVTGELLRPWEEAVREYIKIEVKPQGIF
jgi:dTDP-4-dehydrorhamnose reductase